VIEQHRDQRILDRGHHNGFVHKRVFGAAHAGDIAPQPAFLLFAHVIDNQYLEVGLGQRARLWRQHGLVVRLIRVDAVALQRDRTAAVGTGGQRAGDTANRKGQISIAAMIELAAHVVESRHAGEGPIGFNQRQ